MEKRIDNKCRLCLSTDIIEESIFNAREDDASFSTKIMICAGIMASDEDGFPKHVCNNCADMLDLFFYFRKSWFKTFVYLNSSLNANRENSDILIHSDGDEQTDHNIYTIKGEIKFPKQTFLASSNEKECDLGIDKVVSEEIVFDEEEDEEGSKVSFSERQFRVGCYVPVEDGTEKEFPLLRRFKCTTCKNVFSSIEELDSHWEICEELVDEDQGDAIGDLMNHDKEDTIYEDEIEESGNDEDGAAANKKPNKEFCCEICGQIFKQLWLLTKHRQVKHVCERPYNCPSCPRSFFDKYELKYHQRLHQDVEDFCCKVCGRRFARRSTQRAHMRSHTGEKPYNCSVCGRSFAHHNSLVSHERLHTGERPYNCKYCSRSFAQYSTARTHEEMHMGGLRIHQCETCDRMYKTPEELQAHQDSHKSNTTLQHHCAPCNKGFKKFLELKKHNQRCHNDKSPYTCGECEKSFMTSSEFKNHLTEHKGQPPFTCPFCSKKYKFDTLLQKHIGKHHNCQKEVHFSTINTNVIESNNGLNSSTITLNLF